MGEEVDGDDTRCKSVVDEGADKEKHEWKDEDEDEEEDKRRIRGG